MRGTVLAVLAGLLPGGPALAELKLYDSSGANGQPGDVVRRSLVTCPALEIQRNLLVGHARIEDTGNGSPTLEMLSIESDVVVDLGPDRLTQTFGPGAFIFVEEHKTQAIPAAQAGAGSTAAGGQVSWGLISGWTSSQTRICLSSPASICFDAGCFCVPPPPPHPPSSSYDLGTWHFDAEGDYAAPGFIQRTSWGGQRNDTYVLRGAFMGPSLPALPLVGSGALAAALAVLGARRRQRR